GKEVERMNRKFGARAEHMDDFDKLCEKAADLLADGKILGWFQGRMEYGPRALGNRSILADPTRRDMQQKLNLSIKYRESFRPFAPSVLKEDALQYFELEGESPYMLLTSQVKASSKFSFDESYYALDMKERLQVTKSDLPAITHVDGSARVQTVDGDRNPEYYQLLKAFKAKTGLGMLVNTSFNVRGEPIVCTPEDAFRCFMATEMDVLVIGNYLYLKTDQIEELSGRDWERKYKKD
ncbi:MAG TPA: carbamoyltransferase C-terminal domain-containing protein, partial [Saprospiraceae bacterium]|nr:carbamoyltransferase C-terminal domain-containing protein [Saprospiraceae bacterium]